MNETVKQTRRFNSAIHNYRKSQDIQHLADLIGGAGDVREFFSRNFVTHGLAHRQKNQRFGI